MEILDQNKTSTASSRTNKISVKGFIFALIGAGLIALLILMINPHLWR
jgi:hypothetical protein